MIRDFSHGTRPTTNPIIWTRMQHHIIRFGPSNYVCELRSEMLKLKHTADMVGGAISSSMNWWTASFRFVQNPLSATSLSQDKRGASCISISCKSVCLNSEDATWRNEHGRPWPTMHAVKSCKLDYHLVFFPVLVIARLNWRRKRCLLVRVVRWMLLVAVGWALDAFGMHLVIQLAWLLHEAVRVCPYVNATQLPNATSLKLNNYTRVCI